MKGLTLARNHFLVKSVKKASIQAVTLQDMKELTLEISHLSVKPVVKVSPKKATLQAMKEFTNGLTTIFGGYDYIY